MSYILIFIFGLVIGSFLNVVICRLNTKEKILVARSKCPECGAFLKWYDLIPIFSFLIQKGRCRYCHKKISWQYIIIEIITAYLFLLIFNFQFSIFNEFSIYQFSNLIFYLIIYCFLIIIFVYDLKTYLIPDKIVYPAIIISLIFRLFSIPEFWNYFLSALIPSAFFLLLILVSRGKWMGMGDVKLAFLMGLVLGWPNIFIALMLAFCFGAIIGIFLILFGKKKMKSQIPFGPFLSGATIVVMIFDLELFYFFEKLLYY